MHNLKQYAAILFFWSTFAWLFLAFIMLVGFFALYGYTDLMLEKIKNGLLLALIPATLFGLSLVAIFWEEKKNEKKNSD